MEFDPEVHHRRSIRLREFDYSQPGAYFVTLCAFNKECLFGQVVDGQMRMNAMGEIVHEEWFRSGRIRLEIELGAFVVMPNHIHGIVRIVGAHGVRPNVGANGVCPITHGVRPNVGANGVCPPAATAGGRAKEGERRSPLPMRPRSVASFVAGFKSATTRRMRELHATICRSVWQRNYYEHIVRNERELSQIREYIATNPLRWAFDRENPEADRPGDETPWT
jgi:putative transposase